LAGDKPEKILRSSAFSYPVTVHLLLMISVLPVLDADEVTNVFAEIRLMQERSFF